MGETVSTDYYTPEQRSRYRRMLGEDLEIFDRHLRSSEFSSRSTIGFELELNLVDHAMAPAPVNRKVLDSLSDEYQSELGAFNVELNHPALAVDGRGLEQLQTGITRRLDEVRAAAENVGAQVSMIGTLPTLTPEFLADPQWMTPENRYRALSRAVMDSRGELVRVDASGRETCIYEFSDIAPEASCTSVQLHLQVAPQRFAPVWNAAQAIAGVQVALAANSPLFLGHRSWHESRIRVFRQAIDTRTPELQAQGVRPRVWFGERWITSVFDLFEENVRYFSPLLPEPREMAGTPMMKGKSPALHYLTLHNGTVWRWNRPIYFPGETMAHLRVENRILPAGPTPVDTVADAAFYYGMLKELVDENRPVWSRLQFSDAAENFRAGARSGLTARMVWPTLGTVGVADLVTGHLLSLARRGLEKLEVEADLIDRYLSIIEGRATRRQNGAVWQLRMLDRLEPWGTRPNTPERAAALAELMELYLAHQATGEPVHTWPVAT